ncbi:hypothetical protein OF83DRAFT_1178117 [Amylostereum chailletii]|nr:hypothetical protein OF83DRAFT_1178117 [Amylostereum chailletii]
MSRTLFEELTGTKDVDHGDGFPVTALSKTLLQYAGLDVVQFRRNQQVAYRIVDRSREIYDGINPIIRKINAWQLDDGLQGAEGYWTDFDNYQDAVDALEEALFDIVDLYEEEAPLYLASTGTVELCIADADKWELNRTKLRTTIQELYSGDRFTALLSIEDAEGVQSDILAAQRLDDAGLFSALQRKINNHDITRSVKPEVRELLAEQDTSLEEWLPIFHSPTYNKHLITFAVKFVFVVQGAMDIAVNPNADDKSAYHLKSSTVWTAAKEFVTCLSDAQSDNEVDACEQKLREAYETFINVLKATPGLETPRSYLELMKLARDLRRPYLARSLALIILCRALVGLFNEPANHIHSNISPLETAFDESVAAVNKAIDTYKNASLTELHSVSSSDVAEAFRQAQEKIKACYTQFNATEKWENEEKAKLASAAEKDTKRLGQLQKRLEKSPSDTVDESQLVEVTVTVHDTEAAAPAVATVKFRVEPKTRLAAISWGVCRHEGLGDDYRVRARDASKFEKDGTIYTMDVAVEDLNISDNKCTLQLILLDPAGPEL